MARPPKRLAAHIRDRTFRPARHGHLLGDVTEPLPAEFELFRERYLRAQSDRERQAILLDFAEAIEAGDETGHTDDSLERILATLQLAPVALERIELVRARGTSPSDRAWRRLRSIVDAPPVPSALLDQPGRVIDLYWRARRARGLRRDGLPVALIAERLGVSRRTVQRDLRLLEATRREDLPLIDASNAETGWAWTLPKD